MPIICDNCGTENREGRKFCRQCGQALGRVCAGCGARNDPGDGFCGECGEELGSAPAPIEQPVTAEEPEQISRAEKRFVSVLFADLVGYTTLSEQNDSEEIREMLTTYFERARVIVERFGGAVDKFIGDAVMAVWGATVAREDDAERAVRAALELVDMVEALGEELGLHGLMLRAGVNSGATSVGPGGNEQGLIVGDLVNVASRLQTIAEPGSVLVGEATQAVSSRSIDYSFEGERSVKGKTESVPAWRAIRVASMVGGRAEDEIRQPPFVGRDREMRLLRDALSAVESEGRARLVSVIGEAGIGKSRLAEEFKNHIDGFTHTTYWHQGRSPSYGDGITFWALGEMVRQRAGILEGEDSARAMIRLRTVVADFVPSEEDRQWIVPKLAGLLGLTDMPEGTRSELFSALRSFFQSIAARGPSVLVFEDLHWADEGLLDFINDLVEESPRSPILVVTLARTDLLERHPGWGSHQRNSVAVRLSSLPRSDMVEMLGEYLPGVSDQVVETLADRSAGIPLYAVETVRMLLASGQIAAHDGRYEFVGDLEEIALPGSLQAVIGARLDRLDEEERSVLQDAAVLGQSFSIEALAAIRDADPSGLGSTMRRLVQAEVLDIDDDPRSPERGQYRFIQALIREVAYNRLSRSDRQDKHLRVASHFERAQDPELAGVVAGHIMWAYEASPEGPERDALADRALKSLVDAAERAQSLHSYSQALKLIDSAIAFAVDPAVRAGLQVQAVQTSEFAGDVERGLTYGQTALNYFQGVGDVDGERRAATAMSKACNSNYRSPEALEIIEPVYLAMETVDGAVTARVAAEAGRSYMLNYRPEAAIGAVERLLPVAAAEGLDELVLDSLVTQATALANVGRAVESETILRGAAQVAEESGHLITSLRALNNLGATIVADNPREATLLNDKILDLLVKAGDGAWRMRATFDLATAVIEDGDYERAIDVLDGYDEEDLPEFWQLWWEAARLKIDLLRTGSIEAHDRYAQLLGHFDDVTDPQLKEGIAAWHCENDSLVGRWEDSFRRAIEIGDPRGEGVYLAGHAASWLQDISRVEEAIIAMEKFGSRLPRMLQGTNLSLKAAQSALQGDTQSASRLFSDLIALWEPVAPERFVTQARLTFAMLVGQDDPAAAAAAQSALDWITRTGTNSFLSTYEAGLPDAERSAAASS